MKALYIHKCTGIVSVLSLVVLLVPGPNTHAQFQAMAHRITAQTRNGIRVTAWTNQQSVKLKQDVTINYEVENRSGKTIYLVRQKGEIQTAIKQDGTLSIMVPIPFPDDHGGYNYSFTRVARGGSHKGQLMVRADKFKEERKWTIDIAFGIVSQIDGLNRQLRNGEDPAPLRGLLGQRMLVIGVNGLVIEVEEP